MSKQKSTLTETKKELRAINGELKEAHKVLKDNSKKTLKLLEKLIKGTPEIEAVRWKQYTPGFNDGEPCEFSVMDLEIKFNPDFFPVDEEKRYKDNGEEEETSDFVSTEEIDSFFERQVDVLNFKDVQRAEQTAELLCKIHGTLVNATGMLEETFGTNVEITLTKDGIEKDDYDCGF